MRLLRFLSGRFDYNDACRVDEPGFDKITRSGGATTVTLSPPQRVVHRVLSTTLASLRSSSNCVTSSRHRIKASIAEGPGQRSIHRTAGVA